MKNLFLVIISLILFSEISFAQEDADLVEIEKQLQGGGLGGWVHGINASQSIFVFTWRSSNNFFVNKQFPITTEKKDLEEQIKKWRRHDYVVIKGEFVKHGSPQKHIMVTSIEKHEVWAGLGSNLNYEYDKKALSEVLAQNELVFKVHYASPDGKALVLEYKDLIIPVFNKKMPELTTGLYRDDKLKIKYIASDEPFAPQHLKVDISAARPVEVLERIVEGHGLPFEHTGELIMFPKSPQILFDVFALKQTDGTIERQYTLVNFEDPDLFKKIREKLTLAWEKNKSDAVYSRNKFVNPKLIVRARGIKNVVDPSQANPQILLNSVDDIEIVSAPVR